ncbi:hypothetical protein BpHYR1_001010 [Brachionus plicatilis]|uniref:Uncharacterized protein n=1 Tax=Brachionus plicatilis TaxID=10195 RepID=A0A3M7PB33_BRAPC|nr:hypothetical protein BpHYR1_001010 [Brachionus plicatilis]
MEPNIFRNTKQKFKSFAQIDELTFSLKIKINFSEKLINFSIRHHQTNSENYEEKNFGLLVAKWNLEG